MERVLLYVALLGLIWETYRQKKRAQIELISDNNKSENGVAAKIVDDGIYVGFSVA